LLHRIASVWASTNLKLDLIFKVFDYSRTTKQAAFANSKGKHF
jgi:hypothetical protein